MVCAWTNYIVLPSFRQYYQETLHKLSFYVDDTELYLSIKRYETKQALICQVKTLIMCVNMYGKVCISYCMIRNEP